MPENSIIIAWFTETSLPHILDLSTEVTLSTRLDIETSNFNPLFFDYLAIYWYHGMSQSFNGGGAIGNLETKSSIEEEHLTYA